MKEKYRPTSLAELRSWMQFKNGRTLCARNSRETKPVKKLLVLANINSTCHMSAAFSHNITMHEVHRAPVFPITLPLRRSIEKEKEAREGTFPCHMKLQPKYCHASLKVHLQFHRYLKNLNKPHQVLYRELVASPQHPCLQPLGLLFLSPAWNPTE